MSKQNEIKEFIKDRECLECANFFECNGKQLFSLHSYTENVHRCIKYVPRPDLKETKFD